MTFVPGFLVSFCLDRHGHEPERVTWLTVWASKAERARTSVPTIEDELAEAEVQRRCKTEGLLDVAS